METTKIKWTKRLLKGDLNNLKSSGYYEVRSKIYVTEQSFYRRNFVITFDESDCYDFHDGDETRAYSLSGRKEFFECLVDNFLSMLDYMDIEEFTDECGKTIDHYNSIRTLTTIWV